MCSMMWHLGCSISQRSILGPVLFNVIINDIKKRIKPTLRKFAEDTERSDAVGRPAGWDTIQCDLDNTENWAHDVQVAASRSGQTVLSKKAEG